MDDFEAKAWEIAGACESCGPYRGGFACVHEFKPIGEYRIRLMAEAIRSIDAAAFARGKADADAELAELQRERDELRGRCAKLEIDLANINRTWGGIEAFRRQQAELYAALEAFDRLEELWSVVHRWRECAGAAQAPSPKRPSGSELAEEFKVACPDAFATDHQAAPVGD